MTCGLQFSKFCARAIKLRRHKPMICTSREVFHVVPFDQNCDEITHDASPDPTQRRSGCSASCGQGASNAAINSSTVSNGPMPISSPGCHASACFNSRPCFHCFGLLTMSSACEVRGRALRHPCNTRGCDHVRQPAMRHRLGFRQIQLCRERRTPCRVCRV